jgi:hypothetical protein
VPRKVPSEGGSYDTIYSATERLWAIPIGCALFGIGWLIGLVCRYNLATKIVLGSIGFVIGLAVMACLWIAVVGRVSSD